VILLYSRCTKTIGERPDVFPTRLRIADANVDITIQYPVNYAMLNGNVIGKAPGTPIKSASWKQISGPQAYINNPQTLQTRVSNLDNEGTYEFELTVLDNANHFDQDTMTVRVENATSTNSQIFLWKVKWTQNETGFDELYIDIENFYYFVPINTAFEIFIKREASALWEQIIPSSQSTGNNGYVYYLGNNLTSRLTIYELPEVTTNDKPDIKIVF
jgi:hypothetical protein